MTIPALHIFRHLCKPNQPQRGLEAYTDWICFGHLSQSMHHRLKIDILCTSVATHQCSHFWGKTGSSVRAHSNTILKNKEEKTHLRNPLYTPKLQSRMNKIRMMAGIYFQRFPKEVRHPTSSKGFLILSASFKIPAEVSSNTVLEHDYIVLIFQAPFLSGHRTKIAEQTVGFWTWVKQVFKTDYTGICSGIKSRLLQLFMEKHATSTSFPRVARDLQLINSDTFTNRNKKDHWNNTKQAKCRTGRQLV